MNNMPYVEILIDRCSSKAPSRAASEWIRAYSCQQCMLCNLLKATYTFENYSSQTVSDKNNGASLSLHHFQQKDLYMHDSSTFVNLLFRYRSEIKVLA